MSDTEASMAWQDPSCNTTTVNSMDTSRRLGATVGQNPATCQRPEVLPFLYLQVNILQV